MERRMNKEELINSFDRALEEDSIFAVYQPQINHATGRMIGAEALMRWMDPANGMQYPSDFIPVLEENDLIFRADLHIFEQVCRMQRKCMEDDIPPVPVSINMSRYDIYKKDYVEEIEKIRKKYDVPVYLLRVEITESSAIGGMELITTVLDKLHKYGYVVEMDDFGSGYSSLNILKDLDVDIIKLDMRFLRGTIGGRGGTIISSVVNMSKWLQTPVIAEGVETMEQADYMMSIGCNYIQGYLYSKPVTMGEFLGKLQVVDHEPFKEAMKDTGTFSGGRFWDPESMETLVFNEFVGGAALFAYENGQAEVLRVNSKYLREIGINITEKELINHGLWRTMDENSRKVFEDAIRRAIQSGEEETAETWRLYCTKGCGNTKVCIRSYLHVLGQAGERYLIYSTIRNVTKEKKMYEEMLMNDRLFRKANEQINIYAWEYIYSTKEMHPCYRCMRDLGLPAVVENYPDPVFENGLFPRDYEEEYRKWLKSLEEGVEYVEGVIPLTVGRIPFHIRYTNEYDENGKPLKAYGSAALVVETGVHEG